MQQWSFNSSTASRPDDSPEHGRESPHLFSISGNHYEDPVPFHTFTQVPRQLSIPDDPNQIKPGGSRPKQSSNSTSLSPLATSAGLPSHLSLASPPNGTVATAPKLDMQRQQSLKEQANGISPSHPIVAFELARPNLVSALSATPEDGMTEERKEEEGGWEREGEGRGGDEEGGEGKVEEESREEGHVAVQISSNSSSPDEQGCDPPAPINSERRDGLHEVPSTSQDSQRNAEQSMTPLDVATTELDTTQSPPISSGDILNTLTNEISQSSASDSFHTAIVEPYDEEASYVTAVSTGFTDSLADEDSLTPTASLSSQLLQAERPQNLNPRPESQMFHAIISL